MSSSTEKPADRWFQIGGRLLVVAVIIISYLDDNTRLITTRWIPGAILLVAGLTLNIVSRLYLGKFYSEAVRIRLDHKLITNGPYKLIRHPIYLSVILFAFCSPVILGSLYGFIIDLAIIPMLLHRISVEEKSLVPSSEKSTWNTPRRPRGSFHTSTETQEAPDQRITDSQIIA